MTSKASQLSAGVGVLKRHLAGGTWKAKIFAKKGKRSFTAGKLKGPTCTLTSIGGLPRKAFMKARSYKFREYKAWVAFCDSVNK